MANIVRRREQQGAPMASPVDPFSRDPLLGDPLRVVRNLLRWDPFRELESMQPGWGERAYLPEIDVKETKDAYVFKADLPGVQEQDLDVAITGNRITISGKREEEQRQEDDRYFAYERSYGTFSRSFTLPDGADPEHITAELNNGVLCVSVPKRPEVQPRRIPLGESKGQQVQGIGGESKGQEGQQEVKKAA